MVAPEQARWRSTGTPSRRGHASTERWQRLPATFVPGSKGGPLPSPDENESPSEAACDRSGAAAASAGAPQPRTTARARTASGREQVTARPYPQVLSQVSSCTRVRQGRRALASAGRSPVGNSGG